MGHVIDREFVVPDGMPLSVFNDRYSRRGNDGELQSYAERVREVVDGNFSLAANITWDTEAEDREITKALAVAGVLPFAGRHIQHGDMTQAGRNIEVFTNCSTAAFSFMSFLLLLNGSGVGRDFSSNVCRVNWDFMPNVRVVLDGGAGDEGDVDKGSHPDFKSAMAEFTGGFESLNDAKHKYDSESEDVRWVKVRDCREGWGEVVAILETAAFHRNHKDSLFIFDFSGVREFGAPIKGMQERIAQGPLPLMRALLKVASVKGAGMKPWKQAMFVDHYLAACVVMGNVRRAARIASKYWKDRDIFEFIDIKRGGFLWSANNSVAVDEEFWKDALNPAPSHARRVFEAVIGAAYFDKTGEPGFINTNRLTANDNDIDTITAETCIDFSGMDFKVHPKTFEMIDKTLRAIKAHAYHYITNPCGEIVLALWGGYCVIGDICLANVQELWEAEEAARQMARFLMRTNLMKAIYSAEVKRTNRIGVALTGVHEFAWKFFECGFNDLVSAYDFFVEGKGELPSDNVCRFWRFIEHLGRIAEESAVSYAGVLGVNVPHTFLTIKPSGTISKIMDCTEGAHLPAIAHYLRWVVFPKGSEAHLDHERRGYPIKDVSHQYQGSIVVGFPTKQRILDVMPEDKVVLATDASIEDHYKWISLLEKFWMGGHGNNNQVSYTINYDPSRVTIGELMDKVGAWQQKVRCCTVMPATDLSAFAYIPQEPVSKEKYLDILAGITDRVRAEAFSDDELQCASGVCPI